MRKNKLTILFFACSFLFFIISMPFSGALGEVNLQRTATANIASDSGGILKLEGIDNRSYNLDNKFARIGSITNNTNQILNLIVTITPDLSWGLFSHLKIRIDNSVVVFNFNSKSEQMTMTLSPGQVASIEGSYNRNIISSARVSFSFFAFNQEGTYTMQIKDTVRTPRRIICY